MASGVDDFHRSRIGPGLGRRRVVDLVHLSSLVEHRSRPSSFEKAEVELEHDQIELRSRIARLSERLAVDTALTAQIRPEQQ
jgi:hypothetical protein